MKFSSWLTNMPTESDFKFPKFITLIPTIKNLFTLKIKPFKLL